MAAPTHAEIPYVPSHGSRAYASQSEVGYKNFLCSTRLHTLSPHNKIRGVGIVFSRRRSFVAVEERLAIR